MGVGIGGIRVKVGSPEEIMGQAGSLGDDGGLVRHVGSTEGVEVSGGLGAVQRGRWDPRGGFGRIREGSRSLEWLGGMRGLSPSPATRCYF